MQDIKEIRQTLQDQINEHFDVNIKPPRIKVYTDPQEFFQAYEGSKKKYSLKELLRLDADVSYFFSDVTKTVCFKGFRRDGEKSFKKIKRQTIHVSFLLHEFIHNVQVQTGGYSNYNVTDEGCCEFSTYVISGDVQNSPEYGDFIVYLWHILDAKAKNVEDKYELIRKYNCSKNKTAIANDWFDSFLKKYSKLELKRNQLVKQLEGDELAMDKRLATVFNKYEFKDIVGEIYKLHDQFKTSSTKVYG